MMPLTEFGFIPIYWAEDPPPPDVMHCDDCELSKMGTRIVWGEGNPKADIMIILDNPGAREDREDQPFVCGTRQTLQEAADTVDLTMQDLYVTYILKRRPIRKYDKETTRSSCMQHIQQQLLAQRPRLVLCMGNVAVQAYFGQMELEVKQLRGKWHKVNGVRTAATYHPLAVRRRPNLWPIFIADWQFVANAIKK